MEIIKPKKLKQGDTIGIVAPSSWMDPVNLEECATILKGHGFNVDVHPQCLLPPIGRSAGSVSDKLSALHETFRNPRIDAILCSAGGYEATNLLDKIDYNIIRENPKIFTGFSDTTCLLSAFAAKAKIAAFHGPHLIYFGWEDAVPSIREMMRFLSGNWQRDLFAGAPEMEILREGTAEGILVGGNFPLQVGLLLQKEFMPPIENAILVMEAIGKEIAEVDQGLAMLDVAGVFDKVSGVIFGHFTGIQDTPNSQGTRFNIDLKEVLLRNTTRVKGPVIFNAPIGHEHPNITWPLGVKAHFTATQNAAELFLKESPFSDA